MLRFILCSGRLYRNISAMKIIAWLMLIGYELLAHICYLMYRGDYDSPWKRATYQATGAMRWDIGSLFKCISNGSFGGFRSHGDTPEANPNLWAMTVYSNTSDDFGISHFQETPRSTAKYIKHHDFTSTTHNFIGEKWRFHQ